MDNVGNNKSNFNVSEYWESRYKLGRNSGPGSYNRLAKFKAEFINGFVAKNDIDIVFELGCGDGSQLSMMQYPRYFGLDISATAIDKCNNKFSNDDTKIFSHYAPEDFNSSNYTAGLALSLDVIYHLSNDFVYQAYLDHLFSVSSRYVIIYSNSQSLYMKGVNEEANYVRFRKFDEDIARWFPKWKLVQIEPNSYPFNLSLPDDTSFSDFYVYAHPHEQLSEVVPLKNSYSSFLQKKILHKQTVSAEQSQVVLDAVNALGKKLRNIERKIFLESERQDAFFWQLKNINFLQSFLGINNPLPLLEYGFFDVLLKLYMHVKLVRPQMIVELGSGASTLVIADALRQNGVGKLISIEHSNYNGKQTLDTLQAESLESWVDLRIGDLEAWEEEHLNPEDADKPSRWYPVSLLEDVENVDLLWVDGPPGATCPFSRYPALPALADKLSLKAEVWMDDTIRQEEKDICERWAADHGFELEYFPLEKGLGRLTRTGSNPVQSQTAPTVVYRDEVNPENVLGLDFSLPEDKD